MTGQMSDAPDPGEPQAAPAEPGPQGDGCPAPGQPEGSTGPQETLLLEDLRVVFHRQATDKARPETPPLASLEGKTFGRYAIRRMLGEGGMAQVYLAVDTRNDRQVAFKILRPQYSADEGLCARFEREARSMARIQHENVVRILDFPREGACRAIVMTYLPGGSVRDRIHKTRLAGRLLTIDEAVGTIMQAAEGVEAAHRIGLVHRDIKPSNLLLDEHGQVKVADFGAIMVVAGTTWLTGVGQQIGTPGYMSPEQCRGERVGRTSDVYSLGVTLFELLTGRLPFEVEEASPLAMMLKHISEPAPDPRTFRAEISAGLASAILKSLAKRPDDRYPSAGAFAEALRTHPTVAPPPVSEAGVEVGRHMDLAAIRKQLELLPQRAIVCWACRCARRVQDLNPDPRVERALVMAESSISEVDESQAPQSLTRALSRVRALRVASLKAAYAEENVRETGASMEAARAAAAAASSAAAMCIADTAADAAFAARCAVAALTRADRPIKSFWDAARRDYHKLLDAQLGREGTIGQPIPPSLFRD